ncbi:glycosyltransferase family 4 protein [Clostridium thermarum]|uniref:glycosyltransferase family 4 protein n=1 Tax=Clostridium thermarum TaxID=1716543 RepID=UPI00111DB963|nr:glycosyltransferase family 4 protein [Clostridium thermarum]
MRILYLTNRIPIPAHYNGCTLINYHVLKYLSKKHEIDLVTFHNEDIEFTEKATAELCSKLVTVKNDERYNIKRNSKYSYLVRTYPDFAYVKSNNMEKAIKDLLSYNNYDVIYTDKLNLCQYTMRYKEIPKIITPHDSMSLLLNTYEKNTANLKNKLLLKIERRKMERYEKEVYQYYDNCIFVSQKDIDFVRNFYPGFSATTIANGVDVHYFYPNSEVNVEPDTVIYSGIMDYKPNVDAMIYFIDKILPRVREKIPNVKLYIVGKNPTKAIRDLSRIKNVFVTGYVDDIRKYLWMGNVYVSPLVSGAGIKNKILEAMATGIPIVATPLSCDGIDVKDGQELLIRNNADEFAKGVIELITNKKAQMLLKENARSKILKKYSWESCARAYEHILMLTASRRKV